MQSCKSFRAAAVTARTIFEFSAHLLGVDDSIGGFGKKLNALHEKGHISTQERDILDGLIQAGSAAAHRGWRPKAQDINLIEEVMNSFIDQSFVHPEEIERLKARTPDRPKRRD